MGLETGTYISDLVATNPLSSDLASTSDDHLRLIKSCIKATFPNITGAVTLTHTQINDAAQLSASNSFTGTLTLGDGGDAIAISGSSLSLSPNINLPNAGAAGNRNIKISDRDDAQMSLTGGSGASPAVLQLFGGAYTNFAGAVFIDAGAGSGGTNDATIVMRSGGTIVATYKPALINLIATAVQINGNPISQCFGAYKSSTSSKSSDTTYANDAHLVITGVPAGTYAIDGNFIFNADTGSNGGFKAQVAASGGFSFTSSSAIGAKVATATDYGVGGGSSSPQVLIATAGIGSANIDYAQIRGIVVISATSTVSIQWAQNSSDSDATNFMSGSYFILRKLG